MAETFHCPSCGAPLDAPQGGQITIRCSFCSNTVIVPEAMRHSGDAAQRGRVPPEIEAQIRALVMQGQKIEAIKLYRQAYPVDLRAARDAIEALERGEPLRAAPVYVEPSPSEVQPGEWAEILRLMRAGQRIQAIKLYRQMTGVGLKEAKDAVEALARGEAILESPVVQAVMEGTQSSPQPAGLVVRLIVAIITLAIVGIVVFFLMSNQQSPAEIPVEWVARFL